MRISEIPSNTYRQSVLRTISLISINFMVRLKNWVWTWEISRNMASIQEVLALVCALHSHSIALRTISLKPIYSTTGWVNKCPSILRLLRAILTLRRIYHKFSTYGNCSLSTTSWVLGDGYLIALLFLYFSGFGYCGYLSSLFHGIVLLTLSCVQLFAPWSVPSPACFVWRHVSQDLGELPLFLFII
jgi:hypothetical protein